MCVGSEQKVCITPPSCKRVGGILYERYVNTSSALFWTREQIELAERSCSSKRRRQVIVRFGRSSSAEKESWNSGRTFIVTRISRNLDRTGVVCINSDPIDHCQRTLSTHHASGPAATSVLGTCRSSAEIRQVYGQPIDLKVG